MIISFFKFCLYFAISFVILSFPVEKKPVFNHLYPHLAPYSTQIVEKAKDLVKSGIDKGKQLFKNSLPETPGRDSIKTSFSAVKKEKKRRKVVPKSAPRPAKTEAEIIPEDYTVEERALLQKILKSSR